MQAEAFGCVKNTIRLRSGRYLDLRDPKPEQFTLRDIAGGLSKICRFGGQIDKFYSVAEHLWRCARQAKADGLPLETQKAVLMHDAAEAFIGDVVKPLKIMLPEYAEIERRVESVIADKFLTGVDYATELYIVQKIDREMLIAERRALFSADTVTWSGENEVRRLTIVPGCWSHGRAEFEWIRLAVILGIKDCD